MREEVKILIKLQALDQWLSQAEILKKELPKKIAQEKRALEDAKRGSKEKEAAFKEMELERREKERELLALSEKIGEKKGRLFQVKSNEEYSALLKEIDHMKEQVGRLEDEVILLLDKIEEAQKETEDARVLAKSREMALQEAERMGEEEIRALENQVTQKEEERRELVGRVNYKVYQTYEKVKKNRGYAIVRAKDYTCLGCHMEIPPQTFVEVKKGEELIQCPFCSRILYYWEEDPGRKGDESSTE